MQTSLHRRLSSCSLACTHQPPVLGPSVAAAADLDLVLGLASGVHVFVVRLSVLLFPLWPSATSTMGIIPSTSGSPASPCSPRASRIPSVRPRSQPSAADTQSRHIPRALQQSPSTPSCTCARPPFTPRGPDSSSRRPYEPPPLRPTPRHCLVPCPFQYHPSLCSSSLSICTLGFVPRSWDHTGPPPGASPPACSFTCPGPGNTPSPSTVQNLSPWDCPHQNTNTSTSRGTNGHRRQTGEKRPTNAP